MEQLRQVVTAVLPHVTCAQVALRLFDSAQLNGTERLAARLPGPAVAALLDGPAGPAAVAVRACNDRDVVDRAWDDPRELVRAAAAASPATRVRWVLQLLDEAASRPRAVRLQQLAAAAALAAPSVLADVAADADGAWVERLAADVFDLAGPRGSERVVVQLAANADAAGGGAERFARVWANMTVSRRWPVPTSVVEALPRRWGELLADARGTSLVGVGAYAHLPDDGTLDPRDEQLVVVDGQFSLDPSASQVLACPVPVSARQRRDALAQVDSRIWEAFVAGRLPQTPRPGDLQWARDRGQVRCDPSDLWELADLSFQLHGHVPGWWAELAGMLPASEPVWGLSRAADVAAGPLAAQLLEGRLGSDADLWEVAVALLASRFPGTLDELADAAASRRSCVPVT